MRDKIFAKFYLAGKRQLAGQAFSRLSQNFQEVSLDSEELKREFFEILSILHEAEIFMAPLREFTASGLRPGFNGMNDSKTIVDELREELTVFITQYFFTKYVEGYAVASKLSWIIIGWQTYNPENKNLYQLFEAELDELLPLYLSDNNSIEQIDSRRMRSEWKSWREEARKNGWK